MLNIHKSPVTVRGVPMIGMVVCLAGQATAILRTVLLILCARGLKGLAGGSGGPLQSIDFPYSYSALTPNISSPASQEFVSITPGRVNNIHKTVQRFDPSSLETGISLGPTQKTKDTTPSTVVEESELRTVNPKGQETENSQHNRAATAELKLVFDDCSSDKFILFSRKKGAVRGIYGKIPWLGYTQDCLLSIETPEGYTFLYLLFVALDDACCGNYSLTVAHSYSSARYFGLTGRDIKTFTCKTNRTQMFTENRRFFFNLLIRPNTSCTPAFKIEFESFKEDVRKGLSVQFSTPQTGDISQWGYDGMKSYLCFTRASYTLHVPENHVVMLSFSRFHMLNFWSDCPTGKGLSLYSLNRTGGATLIFIKCGQPEIIPAEVYNSSLRFHFETGTNCPLGATGFKALFSFHPTSQTPQKLSSGLFNCSTPVYSTFKQHLDCNLEAECEGNEDEGEHCSFSSPLCKGRVSSGGKCFSYIDWKRLISSHGAQRECELLSGDLAMMKTESEWESVRKIFQYGKRLQPALFGLRSGDSSFPDLYKYTMKWFDNSIAQIVGLVSSSTMRTSYDRYYELCALVFYDLRVKFTKCESEVKQFFLCQQVMQQREPTSVVFPAVASLSNRSDKAFEICRGGHFTHSFLSCDPRSHCRVDDAYVNECRLESVTAGSAYDFATSMFECDDATMTLHYTLVCDFREDCSDASDETFCIYREICTGFRCHNGQCVDNHKRCNWDKDCFDESDEALCDEFRPEDKLFAVRPTRRLSTPVSINFDVNRHFTQIRLNDSEPCPDTHFRCSSDYCLPVYLRCNDFKDCPGGEDERECREYQCPGFYRCLSSSVCVHADHLCDGWPQCPHRDDEWLCDDGCPPGCACQGHAFVCSHRISVTSFPRLRYLDASGSAMKLRDVTGHVHLVWLSLARCGLHRVTEMDLPNLRTLDLSQNGISSLHVDVFLTLINLKTLILSRNPLVHLSTGKSELKQSILHTLDLSFSSLTIFSSDNISCFPQLAHLNISFSAVDTVPDAGFSATPNLNEVDLRGNRLQNYPREFLKQLHNLRSILSDDFTLCCRQSLPDAFPADGSCLAPTTNAVSSCEDLLGYTHHSALLLAVMLVAVLGNTTCIVWKVCVRKNATTSPLDMLMTNLGVVDLLMGVYSMVIVVADWTYRGRYFSVKHVWTSSAVCKTASVLAVISYEARAFTICIITLQGLLITFSNRIRYSLSKRSTLVACMAIWTLAFGIALLPTLPILSHWKFHGHSDNCVPLSVNMKTSQGRNYAFGVTVVLHFIVSLATFLGQVFVLLFKNSHDDCGLPVAERSVKVSEVTSCGHVVLLDSLRRFAFSLVGTARLEGIYVPDNVNVAFVIFGFPIISALNPLLYALSVALERRRRAAEQRLLVQLARRLATQKHAR